MSKRKPVPIVPDKPLDAPIVHSDLWYVIQVITRWNKAIMVIGTFVAGVCLWAVGHWNAQFTRDLHDFHVAATQSNAALDTKINGVKTRVDDIYQILRPSVVNNSDKDTK